MGLGGSLGADDGAGGSGSDGETVKGGGSEGEVKGASTDGALILAEFRPRYGLHPYRLKATGNFTEHNMEMEIAIDKPSLKNKDMEKMASNKCRYLYQNSI